MEIGLRSGRWAITIRAAALRCEVRFVRYPMGCRLIYLRPAISRCVPVASLRDARTCLRLPCHLGKRNEPGVSHRLCRRATLLRIPKSTLPKSTLLKKSLAHEGGLFTNAICDLLPGVETGRWLLGRSMLLRHSQRLHGGHDVAIAREKQKARGTVVGMTVPCRGRKGAGALCERANETRGARSPAHSVSGPTCVRRSPGTRRR